MLHVTKVEMRALGGVVGYSGAVALMTPNLTPVFEPSLKAAFYVPAAAVCRGSNQLQRTQDKPLSLITRTRKYNCRSGFVLRPLELAEAAVCTRPRWGSQYGLLFCKWLCQFSEFTSRFSKTTKYRPRSSGVVPRLRTPIK